MEDTMKMLFAFLRLFFQRIGFAMMFTMAISSAVTMIYLWAFCMVMIFIGPCKPTDYLCQDARATIPHGTFYFIAALPFVCLLIAFLRNTWQQARKNVMMQK